MNKQRQTVLFLVCLLLGVMSYSPLAYAGGIALYEVGPSQTGLASAGYAAKADDASTLFTNPAGMTRLKKSEFLGGIQPLYTDFKFSPDSRTTTTGSDGDTQHWLPTGSMYYVHNVSPELKVGVGVLGYFGLGLDYGDNWVGRYYVKSATLQGLTIQPTIAYKVNDQISLGVGLNAMYGMLEQKTAINNAYFHPGMSDGQLKVDDTTWGYGANIGILYEVNRGTRLGINYLSEVELDFSARPEFSGIGPLLSNLVANRNSSLDLKMKVPQMIMFSFFHEINDRWAIMGNVGWQEWSRFGKVDVDLNSTNSDRSLTTDLHYRDTWHFALGAQYQVSKPMLLMFGAAYDGSAVKSADMTVSLPMGETYRFGVGTMYQWNTNLSLGLSYELAWLNTLKVYQQRGPLAGTVAGEYNNAAIHNIQVALRYQF